MKSEDSLAEDLDIITLEQSEPAQIIMFFKKDLRRIVSIHAVMFDKLLEDGSDVPLELAELFEDVANTYLGISERISARQALTRHQALKD
jgi:hypothetical protein